MSKAIKHIFIAIFACVCQTNLVKYIRIGGVAPDMMIVFLVLLTSYSGTYGGFCTGSLMAMFYDASVGYVLAINLVAYPFIGWAAAMMRNFLNTKLKKLKHKSYLVMTLICFIFTLMREVLYIGYLFLIGSEQSLITLVRALLCSGYSAFMLLPGMLIISRIMNFHLRNRKGGIDLTEEEAATERNA